MRTKVAQQWSKPLPQKGNPARRLAASIWSPPTCEQADNQDRRTRPPAPRSTTTTAPCTRNSPDIATPTLISPLPRARPTRLTCLARTGTGPAPPLNRRSMRRFESCQGHTTDLQNRSVIGRRLLVEATFPLG